MSFKNNFCKGCLASGEREIKLLENILSMLKKKVFCLLRQLPVGRICEKAVPSITLGFSFQRLFRGCDLPAKGGP